MVLSYLGHISCGLGNDAWLYWAIIREGQTSMHRTSLSCTRKDELPGVAPLDPSQMSIGSFIDTPATGPNYRIQASKRQFRLQPVQAL